LLVPGQLSRQPFALPSRLLTLARLLRLRTLTAESASPMATKATKAAIEPSMPARGA